MGATILIPTRGRPAALAATLAALVPQAAAAGAEVVVVDDGGPQSDGPSPDGAGAVAARAGARRLATAGGRGANAARNLGVAATRGDPVIFLDDDVTVGEGWLRAILRGAAAAPEVEVFGGPIRADIRPPLRSCGREGAPITTLCLGGRDHDAEFVWSANLAIRRTALERVGPFDETLHGRGEEEEWERRHRAGGGRIRYLAGAEVRHRRVGGEATLPALSRAAYALGRTARRYDVRKGTAPGMGRELRTLLACAGHVVRFRCPNMIPTTAHAAGRLREARPWSTR